jgi:hypothetical protein
MVKTKESATGSLSQLENTLEEYFVDKAPFQLPEEVKEAIVKFGPWILLVLMVLSVPAMLAVLGLGAVFAPVAMVGGRSVFSFVPVIVSLLALVLDMIALPGLFNRTMHGWKYAFYAQLLSIVASVLSMQILSAIISAVIGFYILFQIKSKYK